MLAHLLQILFGVQTNIHTQRQGAAGIQYLHVSCPVGEQQWQVATHQESAGFVYSSLKGN